MPTRSIAFAALFSASLFFSGVAAAQPAPETPPDPGPASPVPGPTPLPANPEPTAPKAAPLLVVPQGSEQSDSELDSGFAGMWLHLGTFGFAERWSGDDRSGGAGGEFAPVLGAEFSYEWRTPQAMYFGATVRNYMIFVWEVGPTFRMYLPGALLESNGWVPYVRLGGGPGALVPPTDDPSIPAFWASAALGWSVAKEGTLAGIQVEVSFDGLWIIELPEETYDETDVAYVRLATINWGYEW